MGNATGGDENTVMYDMMLDVRNLIHDQFHAVGVWSSFELPLHLLIGFYKC